MKRCYKCQKDKNLNEFYNCSRENDGKQQKCKECCKQWQQGRKKTDQIRHSVDDITLQRAIIESNAKGISPRQIAKNLKVHRGLIYRILRIHNIDPKDPNRQRKYKIVNESYFDKIDTEDKAYFLGLLWSDGCNMRRKHAHQIIISLQEDDKHIVEELSTKIYGNADIVTKVIKSCKDGCKRKPQYTLRIPSKHISDSLLAIGMTPRKSFTAKWPKALSEDLNQHFIRGVYDGDGGISFNNNSKNYTIGIIGSPVFIKKLHQIIKSKFNCDFHLEKKDNYSSPLFSIKIHGNKKCQMLLDWLYEKSTVQLKRKHGRYIDLCNLNENARDCRV